MESENREDICSDLKPLFENYKKVQTDYALKNFSQQSGDTTNEICNESVQQHFELLINRISEKLKLAPKVEEELTVLLSMKASIMYEQAKVKLSNNIGDDSLQLLENALDEIKDFLNHKQINYIYLRIANRLSYIYAQKGELDKSRTILEEIVNEDVQDISIYSTEGLFLGNEVKSEEDIIKLNKLKINNMQMLAWVLGKLGFHDKHMLLQHEALQKQFDILDGEPTAWISRCCRLAALFQTHSLWVHARYHLAAASEVLGNLDPSNEQVANNEQKSIEKCRAELIRCWIHYGCHLFSYSKKTLLEKIYFEETNSAEVAPDDDEPIEEEPLPENYKFTGLDVTIPDVPAVKIVTTEQARALFMHTHTWLKQERLLYPLRDYPLQYVNAVLDLSELYRFLAFYEVDLDSQYNVQKRRADSLETLINILKDIRPSCYLSVSVELLRELTEVQIELMGINLKRLYLGEAIIDDKSGEENIKRRIDAVCDIHSQLESLGNMMGNSIYEPEAEDEPNLLVTKKTEENISVSENEQDTTEDHKIEDQQQETTNENPIES